MCGFSANQCKNQQVGSARERSADLTESSSEGRDLASSLPHPAARRGRGRPPRQSRKSPPLPPPSASLPEDCNNLWLASPPATLLGRSLFKIPQRLLRSSRLRLSGSAAGSPSIQPPPLAHSWPSLCSHYPFRPRGPLQPSHPPLPVLSSSASLRASLEVMSREDPQTLPPQYIPHPHAGSDALMYFMYFSIHGFTVLSPPQISEGWNLS